MIDIVQLTQVNMISKNTIYKNHHQLFGLLSFSQLRKLGIATLLSLLLATPLLAMPPMFFDSWKESAQKTEPSSELSTAEQTEQERRQEEIDSPDSNLGNNTSNHLPCLSSNGDAGGSALRIFIEYNNRANQIIQKRKESYQKELNEEVLKSPSPQIEDRIFVLTHLIETLKKAISYQNSMISFLRQSERSDPKEKISQLPFMLKNSLKINDTPNKIEVIAEQVEQDYDVLLCYRLALETLQEHLVNGENSEELEQVSSSMAEAIEHQKNLIRKKADYAASLLPPYKKLDTATQLKIERLRTECREEALSKQQYYSLLDCMRNRGMLHRFYKKFTPLFQERLDQELKKKYPQELAVNLLMRMINLHEESMKLLLDGHSEKSDWLAFAVGSLERAIKASQRLSPQEKIIDWYFRSADLAVEATKISSLQYFEKHIGTAAHCLQFAADEAQRLDPRDEVIDSYSKAAHLYEDVANNYTENNNNKRLHLERLAYSFYRVAIEAQKPKPIKKFITWYSQAAYHLEQVLDPSIGKNEGQRIKLHSFHERASLCFINAAQEAHKTQPQQQVIDLCLQAADRFKEVINAVKRGKLVIANHLYSSALLINQAIVEISKNTPREEIIQQFLQSAREEYQQAIYGLSCIMN